MRQAMLFILVILFATCRSDRDEYFLEKLIFGGAPYLGQVTVNIEPPEGMGAYDWGRASLHFVDSGAISRMVLSAVIEEDDGKGGDAGFIMDGAVSDSGWHYHHQGMQFSIDNEGKISGAYTTSMQTLSYSGLLTATRFKMDVVVEALEGTSGGYPAGTLFKFNYDLYRDDSNSEPSSDTGGCKNIRWELRNIWNPSGGAMSLVSVPVCHD